jgi:hypothetical protein
MKYGLYNTCVWYNLKTLLHMSALSSVAMQGEMREYFTRKVSEGKNKMSVWVNIILVC